MMGARMMALAMVVALLATGPLSPVMAQQAGQPATQTEVSADAVPSTSERPSVLGGAGYNMAATVITVVKTPFNIVLCGLGGVTGAAIFLVTLGSAYRPATRAVEEGCRGPWIVTGDDIRPDRSHSTASYGMGAP